MADELYVGLMSGTSLDGVDAVVVQGNSHQLTCLASYHVAFAPALRQEILALHECSENELHRAALLGNTLARCYAEAVGGLIAKLSPGGTGPHSADKKAIRAIGCHGQTVRHAPAAGYTLQINNPALLAELTGITVVADFRSRDIAAGGQGAPLVPAFHDARFRATGQHRVILNIGGIANLTHLAPHQPTTGFDCGPGNMLMDAWIAECRGEAYDADGAWAASGRRIDGLMNQLLQHPFFALPAPKSCGRAEFNIAWLKSHLNGNEKPEDVQATLLALTVQTIAEAVHRCGTPDALYVCGGGARNTTLLRALADALPNTTVSTTERLGLPPELVEAAAFAWLARRTVHGETGNLPAVTGARGFRILGAIYPG